MTDPSAVLSAGSTWLASPVRRGLSLSCWDAECTDPGSETCPEESEDVTEVGGYNFMYSNKMGSATDL